LVSRKEGEGNSAVGDAGASSEEKKKKGIISKMRRGKRGLTLNGREGSWKKDFKPYGQNLLGRE